MSTPLPPPLLVPEGFKLPGPALEMPAYRHPWWVQPPIYRENVPALENKDRTESAQEDRGGDEAKPADKGKPMPQAFQFKEVRSFTIPVIEKEIPVPATEILVTAVTTAGVSSVTAVAGTLVASSLFQRVLKLAKPVTKTIVKKLAKLRKKPAPLTWSRARRLERRLGK